MHNQDDIATRLKRIPLIDMHWKISKYGSSGNRTRMAWSVIASLDETAEFLEVYGWTRAEYGKECKALIERGHTIPKYYAFATYA